MKSIDTSAVKAIANSAGVNKKLLQRLNTAELAKMSGDDWQQRELFALPTKDTIAGVLFLSLGDDLYMAPYEIRHVEDKKTGRSKPIICDFCRTWQSGAHAGSITFRPKHRSIDSISYLCCLDLNCSLHVRNKTSASKLSRAQLREDMTSDERVVRLQNNLQTLVNRLNLAVVD